MPTERQKRSDTQRHRDGELANGQRDQRCDKARERQQQAMRAWPEGPDSLPSLHVIRAGFTEIEVQRQLTRQFQFHGWVAIPEMILEYPCPLTNSGDQQFQRAVHRCESDEDKGTASLS